MCVDVRYGYLHRDSMIVSDILKRLENPEHIKQWKELAARGLRDLAKKTNPFKSLRVSGYYFYVDTKSRTYAIILQGVKPNVGHSRGFGAPVGKRESAPEPIRFKTKDGSWKTTKTQRETSAFIGARSLDTSYYGVSGKPTQFFGLKKKRGVEAFGLVNDITIPIYSETGLVEWITQDQEQELHSILQEAGYTAIEGGKQ